MYRDNLPQLAGQRLLTDGGLETVLIFNDGIDLPEFAAFDVLKSESGRQRLRDYYRQFAGIAAEAGMGFVLESPTWRANPDWGVKIGYSLDMLDDVNRRAIELMNEVRDQLQTPDLPMVVSGCVGPRRDGYVADDKFSAEENKDYHQRQIRVFADAGVDMVTAMTMTYVEEALGVTRAAVSTGVPAVISFTVETDGKLPTGQPLGEAIEQVDQETGNAPVYYMINCAHPTHFDGVLDGKWMERVRGLRANASRCSHAELDEAEVLDDGDPVELGQMYGALVSKFPQLTVFGGCCGTDHRHVAEISKSMPRVT